MDAEAASFLDPRAEYQVTLQGGLLETQANHLTRERLTDLGGPADLNGGPEELAGLEANTNVIITMLAITIIMMVTSISNRKESDDCRFLKVHRPTLPRQPPRQDLPPDLHIEPWSLLSSITNSPITTLSIITLSITTLPNHHLIHHPLIHHHTQVRAHLGNHGRTSVPVKPGVTLRSEAKICDLKNIKTVV